MMTFEKVLEVFNDYLNKDSVLEVVNTKRGYTVMIWDEKDEQWFGVEHCKAPELLQYDEVCGQSQLFRKFASLSYQWDVDKIDQTRYGWLASVENEQLLLRLKKLSKKDLELLTLLFVDGYRQIDVARLWHCSRSAVAQRFKKIKKFLNNT